MAPDPFEGLDPNLLPTAAHEAGHAVAYRLAGVDVAAIHIWSLGGNRFRGRIDLKDQTLHDEQVDGYLTALMAGGEAEAFWLTEHRHYRGVLGGRAFTRARSAVRSHCCSDRDLYRRMRASAPGALTVSAARARAHSLITGHWERIERLALRLGESRHLGNPVA